MNVVEVMEKAMAEAAVEHTNFIACLCAASEALRSANLLNSLNTNALIIGSKGVGKATLAQQIINVPMLSQEHFLEILKTCENNTSLIICHFDKISNIHLLKETISKTNTRIIATTTSPLSESVMDAFFSLTVILPLLAERIEDVDPLVEQFFLEICTVFGQSKNQTPPLPPFVSDLSQNGYSFRRCVYTAFMMGAFKKVDILAIMEAYISKHIGLGLLYLFALPLIKAGFEAFGPQLVMAEKFGFNRNRLRKKIEEYSPYL